MVFLAGVASDMTYNIHVYSYHTALFAIVPNIDGYQLAYLVIHDYLPGIVEIDRWVIIDDFLWFTIDALSACNVSNLGLCLTEMSP